MLEKSEVWVRLADPVPPGAIAWRQDGKVVARDGRFYARFVAYIEANTARERLDRVVPGAWDLTLELLPTLPVADDEGGGQACSFKARLQVLGVVREDVGTGRDYKAAATDAFKRAAVRFGIAHELYAYEQNWVQVDGDGRHAKPLEDPQTAYDRRYGATLAADTALPPADEPACPKCAGRMWDNRATKRNPRAPDFKCRDRACDGVVWPATNATVPAEEMPF
jgi:Rad52/22 family double-strand break repair protein